jgi:DNA adenine methylase
MQPIPCPIPYQGSKRKLAPSIVACIPRGAGNLYEPFCGSAAVSVASVLAHPQLAGVHLNDTNAPLIELWRAILDDPARVAAEYEALWMKQRTDPRGFYDEVREDFNRTHRPELLLYLLARCVKAAVRYNNKGEFNQSPDNRRLGSRPERMRDQLKRVAEILDGRVTFSSMDFVAALEPATPQDVIYMDPPYQGTSTNRDRRYRDILSIEDFSSALEGLVARQLSFIVSYDGRTGAKTHGTGLPAELGLTHVEIDAGRSTQATFLGRDDVTYESLYFSPALMARLGDSPLASLHPGITQLTLI